MKGQNFTAAFTVDQTPEEAFAAINNVRGWWTGEIEGSTDKLGAEFNGSLRSLITTGKGEPNQLRIGIIGAGNIGGTLARHLTRLGHFVSIANSRGPESLTGLA